MCVTQSDWFNLYLLLVCLGAPPSAWEADTSPPWQGSGEDRPRQRKKAEQTEAGADGAGERRDVQAKKKQNKKKPIQVMWDRRVTGNSSSWFDRKNDQDSVSKGSVDCYWKRIKVCVCLMFEHLFLGSSLSLWWHVAQIFMVVDLLFIDQLQLICF